MSDDDHKDAELDPSAVEGAMDETEEEEEKGSHMEGSEEGSE